MPNGKMPSPAENESVMPARTWAQPDRSHDRTACVSWADSGMATMVADWRGMWLRILHDHAIFEQQLIHG